MNYLKKIVLMLFLGLSFFAVRFVFAQTLPVASNVLINSNDSSIALIEGTTTNTTCTATVTDDDGCIEIANVSAVFFRSNVSGGASASDDNNNHYSTDCVLNGGSCTGGADTDATYTCSFPVEYYADPTDAGPHAGTDWTCEVTPSDGVGAGTAGTDTIEMDSLVALDLSGSINFGTLDLGDDTGSTNQQMTVRNTGNVQIDLTLDGYGLVDGDGYAMDCTVGNIDIGQKEYSMSPFAYSSGTDLTDSPVELDFDLPQRTNDSSPSTKTVYWGFGLPASGVGGSCTGTVVGLAVDDIAND